MALLVDWQNSGKSVSSDLFLEKSFFGLSDFRKVICDFAALHPYRIHVGSCKKVAFMAFNLSSH